VTKDAKEHWVREVAEETVEPLAKRVAWVSPASKESRVIKVEWEIAEHPESKVIRESLVNRATKALWDLRDLLVARAHEVPKVQTEKKAIRELLVKKDPLVRLVKTASLVLLARKAKEEPKVPLVHKVLWVLKASVDPKAHRACLG